MFEISEELYRSRREPIIAALQAVHQKGNREFWELVVYWFVGETIKAGEHLKSLGIPYDDLDFKDRVKGSGRSSIRRGVVKNIWEFALLESRTKTQSSLKKMLRTVAVSASLLVHAALFLAKTTPGGKRQKLHAIADAEPDPLVAAAILCLPVHLVEHLDLYLSFRCETPGPLDTRIIKNGFAVAFAARLLRGEPARLMQHGAFYGEVRGKGMIEAGLGTSFHTWGWSYNSHQVPDDSFLLRAFAESSIGWAPFSKRRVLLALPTYFDLDHQKQFLAALPGIARNCEAEGLKLVVRPRPTSNDKTHKMVLELLGELGLTGQVQVEDQVSAQEALSKSRLLVCLSHPSTLFLQTVHVEFPCMALMSDESRYLPEFAEAAGDLMDLGLLHRTVPSLQAEVSIAFAATSEWWRQIVASQSFSRFKSTYAR